MQIKGELSEGALSSRFHLKSGHGRKELERHVEEIKRLGSSKGLDLYILKASIHVRNFKVVMKQRIDQLT